MTPVVVLIVADFETPILVGASPTEDLEVKTSNILSRIAYQHLRTSPPAPVPGVASALVSLGMEARGIVRLEPETFHPVIQFAGSELYGIEVWWLVKWNCGMRVKQLRYMLPMSRSYFSDTE